MDYMYIGDRMTRPDLKGALCSAVRRKNRKCIRGKNGSMLVVFENGETHVVLAGRLRKLGGIG